MALAVAVMAPTLHSNKGKPPLPTALYLLFTISALVYARMVLYDELQLLLGYPPHAGVLMGALIVALALAQLPLLQQRYPHSQSAKRLVACLAAVGLLLAILKPPLPDKVSVRRSNKRCSQHRALLQQQLLLLQSKCASRRRWSAWGILDSSETAAG